MQKQVNLPEDELPHKGQAIEWWYFNGFLEGEGNWAFMSTFFIADRDKLNLKILKSPFKKIFFAHTLLYNLDTKEVKKDILPAVLLTEDSFGREDLLINYFYPFQKKPQVYEIARLRSSLRLKTKFFDLVLTSRKRPLLEGGAGYLDLGNKSTYYYSYSNMDATGFIGSERVEGKAWHDKQWSEDGYDDDHWVWFSLQLPDDTEIVCFDYKGIRMATICDPSGGQQTLPASFTPIGSPWKSEKTGLEYYLNWNIVVGRYNINTRPLIQSSEVQFGMINYWEGPVVASLIGSSGKGFMEIVSKDRPKNVRNLVVAQHKKLLDEIDVYKKKYLNFIPKK